MIAMHAIARPEAVQYVIKIRNPSDIIFQTERVVTILSGKVRRVWRRVISYLINAVIPNPQILITEAEGSGQQRKGVKTGGKRWLYE